MKIVGSAMIIAGVLMILPGVLMLLFAIFGVHFDSYRAGAGFMLGCIGVLTVMLGGAVYGQ